MNDNAREVILESIRSHLAASVPFDKREIVLHHDATEPSVLAPSFLPVSLVELFKQNLEAVDGHCMIVRGEVEIAQALTQVIGNVQKTRLRGQRIAVSDNPAIERWMHLTDLDIEALEVAPNASDIFSFDVGVTTVQAAIAETGTLVLDSKDERHRLVSLVPAVHIAIVKAAQICQTLAEALTLLRAGKEISPAVTFITGPSRTADIELTLAIGVHGPQELYVIIYEESLPA